MTPRSERRAKRPLAPCPAPLSLTPLPLIALGALVLTAVGGPAQADPPAAGHRGKILSMRTVRTGRLLSYDITVTSPDEFPMLDEIVTLSVGGQTFSNSHYLPNGDLNTLVFSLTQKQFQSLPAGATALVYYGQDDAAISKAQWVLGTPDKAMLDRVPIGGPVAAIPITAAPVTDGLVALTRKKTVHGPATNPAAAAKRVASPRKGKK